MTTIMAALIGIIIFISVFTGIGIFYLDLSSTYGISNSTTDFTRINASSTDIENKIKSIQDKIQSPSQSTISQIFDIAALILFDAGGLIMSLGSSAVFLAGEVAGLFTIVPIPSWLSAMIVSIVLTFFVFKIIGLIMKKDA